MMLRNLANNPFDNLLDSPDSVWSPSYSLPTATFHDDRLYRKKEKFRYAVYAHRLGHGVYGLDDGYESIVIRSVVPVIRSTDTNYFVLKFYSVFSTTQQG